MAVNKEQMRADEIENRTLQLEAMRREMDRLKAEGREADYRALDGAITELQQVLRLVVN